jgi:hypothetical protein
MMPGLVYEDVNGGRCKGSPIPRRLAIMGRLHRAPKAVCDPRTRRRVKVPGRRTRKDGRARPPRFR